MKFRPKPMPKLPTLLLVLDCDPIILTGQIHSFYRKNGQIIRPRRDFPTLASAPGPNARVECLGIGRFGGFGRCGDREPRRFSTALAGQDPAYPTRDPGYLPRTGEVLVSLPKIGSKGHEGPLHFTAARQVPGRNRHISNTSPSSSRANAGSIAGPKRGGPKDIRRQPRHLPGVGVPCGPPKCAPDRPNGARQGTPTRRLRAPRMICVV